MFENCFAFINYRKDVKKLGESWSRGIPIEVLPLAHVPVARKINAMFGGEVELRMAKSKMVIKNLCTHFISCTVFLY